MSYKCPVVEHVLCVHDTDNHHQSQGPLGNMTKDPAIRGQERVDL